MLTGVTQEGSQAGRWLSRSKQVGRFLGKSGKLVLILRLRRDGTPFVGGFGDPMLPRKAST